jgi:hypothetical protein
MAVPSPYVTMNHSLAPAELHQLVVRHAPAAIADFDTHLAKPRHNVIAILRHDCEHEQWQVEPLTRCMWIKGRAKITVAEVRNAYCKAYSADCPDLQILLKFGNSTPPDEMRMDQLATTQDQHIVFTCFELAEDGSVRTQLNSREVPTTQSTPSRSQGTPIRQPLQQVNRQLSIPPKPSTDPYRPVKVEGGDISARLAATPLAVRQPSVVPDQRPIKSQEPDSQEQDYKPRL